MLDADRSRPPEVLRKPSYMIASVDHALRLVQMLRDNGSVSVTRAAADLGVSPSTVHRTLGMLVYRGFAARDADRRYVPGPAMSEGPVDVPWAHRVTEVLRPHVELLASRLEETTNIMMLVGTRVRFLHSVEMANVLRIGDRTGSVQPARRTSGGKALLAELAPEHLADLFRSRSAELSGDALGDLAWGRLRRELAAIRSAGYALNDQESELGISAVGFCVRDAAGRGVVACSVAAPAFRAARIRQDRALELIARTRQEMEAAISDIARVTPADRPVGRGRGGR